MLAVAVATLGWFAAPGQATAVDGVVDVRSSHQEGRAGEEGYRADSLWEVYTARQHTTFTPYLGLNVEFLTRRETLEGRSAVGASRIERTSLSPLFNLSYHRETLQMNFFGRALRLDETRSDTPGRRDESLEGGMWFNTRRDALNLDGNLRRSAAWRRFAGSERETHNDQVNVTARYDLSARDEMMYRFSRNREEIAANLTTSTQTSHQLRYRGNHAFADDRGTINVTALRSQFEQREEYDDQFGVEYVLPLSASYVLDDTPDLLDPLEDEPIPVAGLIDNDRSTPTEINLGDNAPLVRDFGGDFRNIMLDFGDPTEMRRVILYVGQRLRFPALMTWEVSFSDDSEGRDWSLRADGAVTVNYQEWENGRQGWVFDIEPATTHRRVKLVNTKLGATEPDIFVTECEVYRPVTESRPESRQTVRRTQMSGSVRFRNTRRLTTWYTTNLEWRDLDADERNLSSASHLVGADYDIDGWVVSGTYNMYRLRSPSRRDSDAYGHTLSIARRRRGDLYGRLSWSRTVDDSFGAGYTTNTLSADGNWRAAPGLLLTQRVTRGWRDDPALDTTADSWSLISEVRSIPRPNLQVDLRRADRWVTVAAGTGFTSFNETRLDVRWQVLPLVNYSGQVVYQRRDESDRVLRNTISWNPWQGGSVTLNLQANDYQDTRTDQIRRGAGAGVGWRPRPRLVLHGSVDKGYERLRGARNWPVNYQLRGYWTF